MSPTETGCLKTKELTATVTTRERARRTAATPPATSTIAMIHPPKTSPAGLRSAGRGITRSARWLIDGISEETAGMSLTLFSSGWWTVLRHDHAKKTLWGAALGQRPRRKQRRRRSVDN